MKLFDSIFLVEIHDFGTKKSGFSAGFLTHWYTRNVIFCSFLYFFSPEKMHEHETAILYVNRDFGPKNFGVKNRVFGCSR